MKCSSTHARSAFAVIALFVSGSTLTDPLTPAQVQKFAGNADRDVIVILRDQKPDLPATRGLREARRAAIAAAQAPIVSELSQVGARKIRAFGLINAVAATVSRAAADRLAAHPLVQAVVPDAVIRMPRHSARVSSSAPTGGTPATSPAASAASVLCNTLEPEALQLTNAAFADPDTPQAQQVLDGNGQRLTGKGVKVAFLADGLDTTIAGFTRPDGSPVFIDYQDFSGDPAGTPSVATEAFGDASSIAAQDRPNGTPLLFDISKFVNPAHPLPSPCNIRIRGMAPGASLVGLNVFNTSGGAPISSIVQAIEWAIGVDDVDLINMSLGAAVFPDAGNDPYSLAIAAAIRAGVTVVVSTGDAGSAGSLDIPATEPDVIAVGATTQFRTYAQQDFAAMPLSKGGYIDNNISSLSSGGFAQTGTRTVDVVAPGDFGWALCSSNTNLYTGCIDNTSVSGAPSAIQVFGGTSEAAPLTAGEAALVIQAYRSTHRGANPDPALVRRIIMSTASDLGAPSYEQGAGLINALKAVQVALSVRDPNGSPSPVGNGLLISPVSSGVIDLPNAREVRTFTITNTGSTTQHLVPTFQTLGTPMAGTTITVQLDPATDPTFINAYGESRPYVKQTFTVPEGAQHLDAAVAFKTLLSTPGLNAFVFLGLLDPAGRQAAYSLPQGSGNGYGHVDVVNPAAGAWTAVVFTHPAGDPNTYAGPVQFTWSAERYTNLGSVSPASFDLAPGASQSITAAFAMQAQPGDLGASIRFLPSATAGGIGHAEIPVTLRTLIPIGQSGGTFAGTLTGGNGRPFGVPYSTYLFDVPQGVDNMSLDLSIADNNYLLQGLLVDPQGMELSVQPNLDPSQNNTYALQHFRSNPQPGRWRFILVQNFLSSGNQTELPFTAQIGFNTGRVMAAGLPNSANAKLHASVPVTFPVVITNTGAVTELFFADARLRTPATIALAAQPFPFCSSGASLPGGCTQVLVPPEVNRIQFIAQSTVPIQMDAGVDTGCVVNAVDGSNIFCVSDGTPDLFARPVSPDTVMASLTVPEVPYGPWVISPSLIGPFGPAGAQPAPFTTGAVAQMQPFDPAVSADSGNIWADLVLGTSTFNPLVLAPGQSGTIHLTITPPNNPGATVSGYLYIDTYNFVVSTGDEVVRVPYRYTIVP